MIPKDSRHFEVPLPMFPPVSFVLPAHDESRYIEKTLRHLKAVADELRLQYEIIVVDDASTDDTGTIAANAGARVIEVALRNIGAVRNAGARAAKNDWLIFIDADTIVPSATLLGSLRALSKGCLGGGAFVKLDDTSGIHWSKMMMYYAVSLCWQTFGRWAAGCYMFCQKSAFESFGGFDERYFAAEELFFSRRLKNLGRFQLVREPVLTSARKFHGYSTGQLLRFVTLPFLASRDENPLQSKRGLEILYEDDR